MDDDKVFEHGAAFEPGEVAGGVRVDRFEAYYEQLFAEVIEDGVITPEERARLDKAATSLGLDKGRLAQLEQALGAAYETRYRVVVREAAPDDEPRPSLSPLQLANDAGTVALRRRIEELEGRVAELTRELEEARAHVAVEVDLSDVASVGQVERAGEAPAEAHRRVRRDPRDVESLRALYRAYERAGDLDGQHGAAQALEYLGKATAEERAFFQRHRADGLIRPTGSLGADAWRRLLFHPDEEVLTGEIFAVIAPAVLLGRVAALRHAKALPALDPTRRLDPRTSTLQAVRCFAWAAAILGMTAPPFYADPAYPGFVEMVPGVPPSSRLGGLALSGRSPGELAFIAGRHLAWYREERFVRLLVPAIPDLEDLFLTALVLGNPGLPLGADARRRVAPLARAIEPILEPQQVDRLRGHFLRFVEDGGRTNLQRWATAADRTALRAGFVLAGDLATAERMLALESGAESAATTREAMDDLLVFATSERYGNLRRQLGIAL